VDPRRCRLERGQFNDVVIVGTEKVLRFPRTRSARTELPRIVRLLEQLDVGVTVPRPEFPQGQGFAALTYVPGTSWRPEWTVPVADFIRLLNRMSTVDYLVDLAPAPDWSAFAHGVRNDLFALMSPRGRERAAAELEPLLRLAPPARPTLVHGDLGGTNLRFTDGRLAGVLDWDEAHLGDPAADLASIAVTVGWPAAHAIAPELVPRARVYAATFALQQALPAVRAGDQDDLRDGLARYVE
jgi:aminoglycoside phosphotransferase (APT) family kinase protein